jgi:hypothetical protein
MTNPLVACPSCNRHLRTTESVCPFCAADVREAMSTAAPRPIPTERLSRSAMFAFAAANLGVAACGGTVEVPGPGTPDGAVSNGGASGAGGGVSTGGYVSMPHYGVPPMSGGSANSGGTSSGGTMNTGGYVIVPPYGVPPMSGGSANSGGTNSGGTMNTGGHVIVPPYGVPPPPMTGGTGNTGGDPTNTGGYGVGGAIYGAPFPPKP